MLDNHSQCHFENVKFYKECKGSSVLLAPKNLLASNSLVIKANRLKLGVKPSIACTFTF